MTFRALRQENPTPYTALPLISTSPGTLYKIRGSSPYPSEKVPRKKIDVESRHLRRTTSPSNKELGLVYGS